MMHKFQINKISKEGARNFLASLKLFNWKLFLTLIIISLIPTIYSTVRIFFLGKMDDYDAYSIASQISWLNIFYEVINEAILLPLFFLISKVRTSSFLLEQRVKTGIYINFIVYLLTTIIILASLRGIVNFMITDPILRDKSYDYIFLESISLFFYSIVKYVVLILMILSQRMKILLIFFLQMVLIIILDIFFISNLSVSLKLSVVGIGYSNIITNILTVALSIGLLYQIRIRIFYFKNLNFKWLIQYFRIAFFSGMESLVRNAFFTYMVLRVLNEVNGSGNYWIANGFIWSWMLLPVLQLGSVIKSVGEDSKNKLKENLKVYLFISTVVVLLWLVLIPTYGLFIRDVLGVKNFEYITKIILILLPFYVVFTYNVIFNGLLVGWGRADLLFYQSLISNVTVYSTYFALMQVGIWVPSVEGVAIMFGIAITVNSAITIIMFFVLVKYKNFLKSKTKIKKDAKIFIFGMPTVGKTTFFNQNKKISFDSECIYSLNSMLTEESYNTFNVDHKLSKKIISISNKKLLKSNKEIIFYSILPEFFMEEIDWLIYKKTKVIYVLREGKDYSHEWNKRKEIVNDLSISEAQKSFIFSKKQAKALHCKIIILKQGEYLKKEDLQ